jgi:hypothetical protein
MPSNNKGTHRLMGGFMEHATEMGTCAMIWIPSFIKTGSDIQKLMGGIHRHTESMVISQATFIFFSKQEK